MPRGGWSWAGTVGEAVGKPPGVPVGSEAKLLAACPSPARRGCSRHPSLPACLPPIRACRLTLSPSSPGSGSPLLGTAWLGKEPDSSRLAPGRCQREQSHPVALHPLEKVGGRRQGGWRCSLGMRCKGARSCLGPQSSQLRAPSCSLPQGARFRRNLLRST